MKANNLKHNKISLGYYFRRLGAYAVDWYLYSVILIGFNVFYSKVKGIEPTYFMTLECYEKSDTTIVMLLMLFIHFLIFVVLVKVLNGQTLGKKLFKLRIVSTNNQPVTIFQLLLREFVGLILIEGSFSPISSYFRTYLAIHFYDIMLLIGIWYLVSFVSLVIVRFNPNGKMVHDIIGKTKVIDTKLEK